jgi:hypothetical protein
MGVSLYKLLHRYRTLDDQERQSNDPLEQFIGAFRSHGVDWADQHGTYLGKAAKDSMDPTTSKGYPDA